MTSIADRNRASAAIQTTANEQFAALSRVSRRLSSSLNLSEVFEVVLHEAHLATAADSGQISLYRESDNAFVPRQVIDMPVAKKIVAPFEEAVMVSHKGLLIDDFPGHEVFRSALIVPILYEGVVAGLISLYSRKQGHFDKNDLTFVNILASQVTIAIVNAQLLQDTLQRERFYAALGRVTLALTATFELQSLLKLICRESLGLFNVDGAYIWQRQDDRLVGIAAEGHAGQTFIGSTIAVDESDFFAATVAARGEGIYCNNFKRDKRFVQRFPWQTSVEAVLGVPLEREGDIMGVLELVDTSKPDRFGRQEIELTTMFGIQAATVIQNAQLVTEMRRLNEQLDERVVERTLELGQERDRVRYLLRVTSDLASTLDQDRVLIRALELINEVVQATHGSILLVDAITGDLIYPTAFETHKLPPLPRVDLGYRPEKSLAGLIIKNRTALIINDTLEDERWGAQPDRSDLRSVLAVPLISNDEVIGVLTLFHMEPHAFSQEQLDLVEAAAIQVASAISNAQLYLLIRDQAERLGRMLREEHIEAAKSQAILESIADGVVVADASGMIVLANQSASQILETPRNRLQGNGIGELLGLYATEADVLMWTIQGWSASDPNGYSPDYMAERLTIEDKSVSMHLSPVFASGQFFGTVSIFRDVTQEVEVDRMKSEFVSTVSHELRTPMTSIKGYAELMLMGAAGSMTADQLRYLEVIRDNADRMSGLVNDLLDISRIESGTISLELHPVDICHLVKHLVDTHMRGLIEHENKPMHITIDLACSLPLVNADHDRITQVLTNLLDNAFYYTPADGHIDIKAWTAGEHVYISVSDTGIGIAQEHHEKIFERFFRTDDALVQGVPGTGLGLSIVRNLVEMHGGDIKLVSTRGRGSTFTFSLPVIGDGELVNPDRIANSP